MGGHQGHGRARRGDVRGLSGLLPGEDRPGLLGERTVTRADEVITEQPRIRSPKDWFTLVTRLRLVMEDPRQLLSGAVTDYAAQQLIEHGNDPLAVTVPGLDDEPYPAYGSISAAA